MDHISILKQLYNLCELGFDLAACVTALEYLDKEFRESRFDSVDALLKEADVEKLRPSVILVVVGFTKPEEDHLPQRSSFLGMAERKMVKELGETRTLKLLEMRR